ncbi:uncharacterized protein OCT59_010712 [Rhizophagus irregularis]|uniref:uncharacterized protein n=1 Tax=Rhizophagus irregularis TaxID=588596 RepID=UPI00332AB550|nr:hypothetical protein OCT59_010712 [Rhizophagus irregularis]
MNVTKEIHRINAGEIDRNISTSASWHAQYKDSPYIFIGNIPYDLTEGDIITIFSQFGEVLDLQLVRNKQTGESKGFAFLRYEDQRSTILAVDNLNNFTLLGRTLRVDHASAETKDGEKRTGMNAAPPLLRGDDESISGSDTEDSENFEDKVDPDDPMREYIIKKLKKEKKKAKKKAKKEKKKKRNKDEEIGEEREVTKKRSRSRSNERDLEQNKRSESYIRNKSRSRSRSSGHDVRRHEYDRDERAKDVTRDRSRSRSKSRYDRGHDLERNHDKEKVDNKDFRGRDSQSDVGRSRRVTRRSRSRSKERYYSGRGHRQRYGRSPPPSHNHDRYDRHGRHGRYDRHDNGRNNRRSRSRSVDRDRRRSERY